MSSGSAGLPSRFDADWRAYGRSCAQGSEFAVRTIWIYADHFKGEQAEKSPGFGLSLFAETIKGSNGVARFQLDVLFSRRLGYTLRTFKF